MTLEKQMELEDGADGAWIYEYSPTVFENGALVMQKNAWITVDSAGRFQYGSGDGGYAGEEDLLIMAKRYAADLIGA